MTDMLSGKDDAKRIIAYAESLAKESRKALTVEFNQKHKGKPFSETGQVLRESLLAWFSRRDKNLKLIHETTNTAKMGEVRATFNCEAKKVRFRVQADAIFTLVGESLDSPCYLRELNVTVNRGAIN